MSLSSFQWNRHPFHEKFGAVSSILPQQRLLPRGHLARATTRSSPPESQTKPLPQHCFNQSHQNNSACGNYQITARWLHPTPALNPPYHSRPATSHLHVPTAGLYSALLATLRGRRTSKIDYPAKHTSISTPTWWRKTVTEKRMVSQHSGGEISRGSNLFSS
jgi:hypothetical protein